MVPYHVTPPFTFLLAKKLSGRSLFCQEASVNQPIQVKSTMAATPPKKSIVNPALVGVDAVGAAGVSRTRSGKGLVKTNVFRVSSNLDARVPR